MATRVFVSAGTPANASQKEFRDAVVNAIELAGLAPRVMDANDWDYKNPLRGIRRAMDECRGAVVIAYSRYKIDSGVELHLDGDRSLQAVAFPTAWNQIEAAMAYERGFPLLVIAEKGLLGHAMLDASNDIRPFWTDLDCTIGRSEGFVGYIRSWKQDIEESVEAASQRSRSSAQELTITQLFTSLPWYELVALFATIAGLLVAAASFGYRIGSGQWPFS